MKKVIAIALALVLFVSVLPVQALAAENAAKEEVVYVNLDGNGNVKEINVVNIFDLKEGGTITDYGDYTALRNMTSTDTIDYADNTVTIQAGAGKLYYEGKLNSNVMPWNIDIRYFINDKEYSAQEVAGKTGSLKITIEITRNEASNSTFFDAFALQVNLTLDTAKCSNIVAQNATVANVGSSKQLTHTILPGSGANLEITADVVDFSMDGIAINAIPLNLNVEVDNSALTEQVTELLDAIEQLDAGAEDLKNGIAKLQNGAGNELSKGVDSLVSGSKELEVGTLNLQKGGNTLNSGAKTLQSGAAAMHDGLQALNSGVQKIQSALNTLNSQSSNLTSGSAAYLSALTQLQSALNAMAVTDEDLSALTNASFQILAGTTELADGAELLRQNVSFAALKATMASKGLDVDSLRQNNSNAAALLQSAIAENRELIEMAGMGDFITGLESVITLLNANNAFIDGTGVYLDTLGGHMTTLADGAALLQSKYTEFDSAIGELANAMGSLTSSMGQLTSAVNTLVAEYSKIDSGIGAYTGAVAEITAGYTEVANGAAKLASSSGALKDGAAKLYAGTGDLLSGIGTLYQGANALSAGSVKLDSGVTQLLNGISQLFDGSKKLEDGTSTMRDETDGMDGMINEKVDDMLAGITGKNVEISSFVSDRNEEVESVQFVIRTEGIQMEAEDADVVGTEENLTFWQKLLKLFGF